MFLLKGAAGKWIQRKMTNKRPRTAVGWIHKLLKKENRARCPVELGGIGAMGKGLIEMMLVCYKGKLFDCIRDRWPYPLVFWLLGNCNSSRGCIGRFWLRLKDTLPSILPKFNFVDGRYVVCFSALLLLYLQCGWHLDAFLLQELIIFLLVPVLLSFHLVRFNCMCVICKHITSLNAIVLLFCTGRLWRSRIK